MIVEVTTQDIKYGERASCFECPIARAIGRLLQEGSAVSVSTVTRVWSASYSEGDSWVWEGHLPVAACAFIQDFDDGCDVKPFSFDIPIPEKFLRSTKQ